MERSSKFGNLYTEVCSDKNCKSCVLLHVNYILSHKSHCNHTKYKIVLKFKKWCVPENLYNIIFIFTPLPLKSHIRGEEKCINTCSVSPIATSTFWRYYSTLCVYWKDNVSLRLMMLSFLFFPVTVISVFVRAFAA